MTRKQRKQIGGLFLAAGLIGLLAWLLTPPEHNLFKRAKIVEPREDFVYPATVGRLLKPLRLQGDWPYCWVGQQALLTLHFAPESIFALRPRLLDLTATRHLPVSHLAAFTVPDDPSILIWSNGAHVETGLTCNASPDGAWILALRKFRTRSGDLETERCVAVRTDDTRQIEWRLPTDIDSAAWTRDTRQLVTIVTGDSGYRMDLFDLDHVNPTTSVRVSGLNISGDPFPFFTAPAFAGTLPDGSLLATLWTRPVNGRLLVGRFSPDVNADQWRTERIPVPAGRAADLLVAPMLSPGGDRLAWFVSARRTPLGWPSTRAFWSMLKMAPSTQIALYTTKPDGSDPVEIGAYTPKDETDRPSLLQWTSNGRSLSFRHLGALYTVPAQ